MRGIRAVLTLLVSQKLTTLFLVVAVLGPLAFVYGPDKWGPEFLRNRGATRKERFPIIRPHYESADGALVWPHYDWRKLQEEAAKSGEEQALWFALRGEFQFLPRNATEDQPVEPGQPENLHEIVPELAQLTLEKLQLKVEDWRDVGQLTQLRLFEGFEVSPPPGEPFEVSRVAAEALSALPSLKQLNLLRTGWIRLGLMPQLEVLILDITDLEAVLPSTDLAAQLPKLQTLFLRLPPRFELTEGQAEVLQQLSQLPQLQRVELITGLPRMQGFLTTQMATFSKHLPGLNVCRGEQGFSDSEKIVFPAIGFGLLISQFMFSSWLWSLGSSPQAGTLPGFHKVTRALFVAFAVLMIFNSAWVAWLLDMRWYGPVSACLLAVGVVGMEQLVMQLLPGSRRIGLAASLTRSLPFLAIVGFTSFPRTAVPLFIGDFAIGNLCMLLLAAGAFVSVLTTIRRPYALLLERGDSAVAPAGLSGGENRQRAAERWRAELQGTTVPSLRLLKGSFSARLRAGTVSITAKQLSGFLFLSPIFIICLLKAPREVASGIAGSLCIVLVFPIVMRMQSWQQRTQRLASDFLLPVGRDAFWRHLRSAVFRDFAIGLLAVLIASIAVNIYRDSFTKHFFGTALQLVLQIGQLACAYSLAVLTFVTRKSQRRLFMLQVPMGLTLFIMYIDSLSEVTVPGATYFQPMLLPLTVLPALAGVVLLVKLPGILTKRELP